MRVKRTPWPLVMYMVKNLLWARHHKLSLVVVALVLASCADSSENVGGVGQGGAVSSTKDMDIYIDLQKSLERPSPLYPIKVSVTYDHYFKSPKSYKGYDLNSVLSPYVKQNHLDTNNTVVVFHCSDGYKPVMDLQKIYASAKGYLVYKNLSQQEGQAWPDSLNKKFAPYYLVWDDVKKDDESYMWPYGLTGIQLVPAKKIYNEIFPFSDPRYEKGFYLFRNNCMKCHSINKVGGSMGPEFNVPKNITEYWKEDDMISFAKKPASYRYRSNMPPITKISDADLREIVSYIRYMKNHKIQAY